MLRSLSGAVLHLRGKSEALQKSNPPAASQGDRTDLGYTPTSCALSKVLIKKRAIITTVETDIDLLL